MSEYEIIIDRLDRLAAAPATPTTETCYWPNCFCDTKRKGCQLRPSSVASPSAEEDSELLPWEVRIPKSIVVDHPAPGKSSPDCQVIRDDEGHLWLQEKEGTKALMVIVADRVRVVDDAASPVTHPAGEGAPTDVAARITEYLSAGGLFNPEMMEHDKVRDLLIDCRAALGELASSLRSARDEIAENRAELERRINRIGVMHIDTAAALSRVAELEREREKTHANAKDYAESLVKCSARVEELERERDEARLLGYSLLLQYKPDTIKSVFKAEAKAWLAEQQDQAIRGAFLKLQEETTTAHAAGYATGQQHERERFLKLREEVAPLIEYHVGGVHACHFDHHGNCQEHGWSTSPKIPCLNEHALRVLSLLDRATTKDANAS